MLGRLQNPYRELEKLLGYRFKKRALLEQALTHPSHRFENDPALPDNQRLEFLGDAVLGTAAAGHLFSHHAATDEGRLTALRSQVTGGRALARVARELGLGEYLRLGQGEEGSGGRERASNLEDALEAILGAAFLDGGMRAATRIFDRVFAPLLDALDGDVWAGNPKGKLQEYAQRQWRVGPQYRLESQEGPPHAMVFTVAVRLHDGRAARGQGRSKQEAERRAAAAMLAELAAESRE